MHWFQPFQLISAQTPHADLRPAAPCLQLILAGGAEIMAIMSAGISVTSRSLHKVGSI